MVFTTQKKEAIQLNINYMLNTNRGTHTHGCTVYTEHNLNHLLKDPLPIRTGPYYFPLLKAAALTARGRCCWGTSPLLWMAGNGAGFCSSSSRVLRMFPRQHLPLFSRRLIALENFFHRRTSSEVLSLTPMPPTYQQSVIERGTPSPTGHEEGAGAPVLPQENGRVLQLTRLLSKLSQLLAVPRSEIPLPSLDNFWDCKDYPLPQFQTRSLNFPKTSKSSGQLQCFVSIPAVNLIWVICGYMKPFLKLVVILDQNKGGRFLLWKSRGECFNAPRIQASNSPKWKFSDAHSSPQSFSRD